MFRFKKKRITHSVIFVASLIFLACLIAFLKNPALYILKHPLNVLTLIDREIKGVIFYHRNFIQNEKFKHEIDLLRQRLHDLKEVKLENQRLNNLLNFKQKSPYRVIVAKVIGRPADNWSSMIILNKGSLAGISRDDVVISYLGLLGRVVEATDSTSKVMLINDPNSSASALTQRSRQEGLVCGTIGNSLIMRYISKDSDLKVDDEVITSGLTPIYPKGLLIGKIVSIHDEFSGLSRYAIIRPAVNLEKIEEVLVIIQ